MLTFSLLEQSEGLLCCSLSFHPILGLSSVVREVNFFFHSASLLCTICYETKLVSSKNFLYMCF